MRTLVITLFVCLAAVVSTSAQSADIVIRNANVHTMDAKLSTARSIAMLNGRIVAVGSDADTKKWIGKTTRVIDAGGRLVMPGFNDAHVHFTDGGMQLSLVDLRSAMSQQEFAERIKAYLPKLKPGGWVLGGRWDHENWKPNDLPTRQLIDAVSGDHPVFVERLDGHMGVANSLALKLAGVTKDTKDVPG
ncbi:MAG TPA: amidohydrolase family protein, partial [Pyrinomonadaceae bacterium]|nr:amidohydrolase family protein [Pyrinomonadaceae bacterium]